MAIIVTKPSEQTESTPRSGLLSVVATPIGNLGDISERARATLSVCDVVAAEDTRHSGTLLKALGLEKPMLSLHDHNERRREPELVRRLQAGAHIALISDAGTPAISDPGYHLIRAAALAGVRVETIPGACALIAALSISGLPTDRFSFEGFLPAAAASRRERLAALADEPRTLIFYEAPHRIRDSLAACREAFGASREACVGRELTKRFETVYRATLGDLSDRAAHDQDFARGEIVLLIAPAEATPRDEQSELLDRALKILLQELPLKQAANLAAQLTGARANECYKRALQLKTD